MGYEMLEAFLKHRARPVLKKPITEAKKKAGGHVHSYQTYKQTTAAGVFVVRACECKEKHYVDFEKYV